MTSKACNKCGLHTEAAQFAGGGRKGKRPVCKPCWAEYMRGYNSRPHAKLSKRKRDSERYFLNPDKHRDYILLCTYGITVQQYEEMLAAQNGKCAVCGVDDQLLKKRLAVDHCHKTGKIRGLLCSNCNLALGYADDDPDRLMRLIQYLKES